MISSSAWGTKWYITLFVNTVPFSQQLRLWDALWLDGRDVIIITAIAILWSFRGESIISKSSKLTCLGRFAGLAGCDVRVDPLAPQLVFCRRGRGRLDALDKEDGGVLGDEGEDPELEGGVVAVGRGGEE